MKKRKKIEKSSKINEEAIISLVFENRDKLYQSEKFLYNEIKVNNVLRAAAAAKKTFNTLTASGTDNVKNVFNKMKAAMGSAAVFTTVCNNIVYKFNKTDNDKSAAFQVIKAIYQDAQEVLKFFEKSKYRNFIFKNKGKYYTWDLALGSIFIYEGEKEGKVLSAIIAAKQCTPETLRQKITEYKEKIDQEIIDIGLLKDIINPLEDLEQNSSASSSGSSDNENTNDESFTDDDINDILSATDFSSLENNNFDDFIKSFAEALQASDNNSLKKLGNLFRTKTIADFNKDKFRTASGKIVRTIRLKIDMAIIQKINNVNSFRDLSSLDNFQNDRTYRSIYFILMYSFLETDQLRNVFVNFFKKQKVRSEIKAKVSNDIF